MSDPFRVEKDFLGEKRIPESAYWGIHTARAVENFPISGTTLSAMPDLTHLIIIITLSLVYLLYYF